MLRLIFITGDGRSGSTILESILNNSPDVVAVGECMRFWERFYKNETYCGCGRLMGDCMLWKDVHESLVKRFPDYDVAKLKGLIREATVFQNRNAFQSLKFQTHLIPVIEEFYLSIGRVSGKDIIVDSSKSPLWGKILATIPGFDVRFIHLERSLAGVARSWKKKVLLPEFVGRRVHMPLKNNTNIIRDWLKNKYLGRALNKYPYLFVRYETFIKGTEKTMMRIFAFLDLRPFNLNALTYRENHGIAGNPLRLSNINRPLVIERSADKSAEKESALESVVFDWIDRISNLIIK